MGDALSGVNKTMVSNEEKHDETARNNYLPEFLAGCLWSIA
jgi:hypothetical protein